MKYLAPVACLALCVVYLGCTHRSTADGDTSVRESASDADAKAVAASLVKGYTRGFEEARQKRMPMLVLFTAPECVYCRQMLTEVFANRGVCGLSKQFVCIQVDAEEEPGVCRDFRIQSYPTIQFMTPQGVPLNRLTGKRSADQLTLDMQTALDAVAGRMAKRPVEAPR